MATAKLIAADPDSPAPTLSETAFQQQVQQRIAKYSRIADPRLDLVYLRYT